MIFQDYSGIFNMINPYLQAILPYVSMFLNWILPFLTTVGGYMKTMAADMVQILPSDSYNFYILAMVAIVIVGVIVNYHWPGGSPDQSQKKDNSGNKGVPQSPVSDILSDKHDGPMPNMPDWMASQGVKTDHPNND